MTLKEAKKEAVLLANKGKHPYLAISKQTEIGWYVETAPTQRAVFWVNKDGSLELHQTDFARNYYRQHLRNVRIIERRY